MVEYNRTMTLTPWSQLSHGGLTDRLYKLRKHAHFAHRDHRNRRMVITETADGDRSAMVTMIGWTYFSEASLGSRREGPFSTSLWAVWMRRSQIASAWVGSAI